MDEFQTQPTGDGGYVVGDSYTPDVPETLGVPETPNLPTQIAFPLRTIVRTLVQNLVGVLLAWLYRLGMDEVGPGVASAVVDFFTASVWAVGTAAATWLMNRKSVNEFLTKIGFGARPARAI